MWSNCKLCDKSIPRTGICTVCRRVILDDMNLTTRDPAFPFFEMINDIAEEYELEIDYEYSRLYGRVIRWSFGAEYVEYAESERAIRTNVADISQKLRAEGLVTAYETLSVSEQEIQKLQAVLTNDFERDVDIKEELFRNDQFTVQIDTQKKQITIGRRAIRESLAFIRQQEQRMLTKLLNEFENYSITIRR